jgi:lysozyme
MHISKRGLDLIYHFEGRLKKLSDGRYKAYKCPAGVWTIYAGCTEGVHPGMIVTEDEGEEMFRRELAKFEKAVERLVTCEMNQCQFDALVSFAYNVGSGGLAKSSVLRHFNRGNIEAAAKAFHLWNKGGGRVLKGLVRRRAAEAALFLDTPKIEDDLEAEPDMPQAVEPSPEKPSRTTVGVGTGVAVTGVGGAIAQTKEATEVAKQIKDIAPPVPPWASYAWPALVLAGAAIAVALLMRRRS